MFTLARRWALLVCSLLVLTWSAWPAAADTTVHARLLPTNHSGVHGTATLTAHDGSLTVVIHAQGLVPNSRTPSTSTAPPAARTSCARRWPTTRTATGC